MRDVKSRDNSLKKNILFIWYSFKGRKILQPPFQTNLKVLSHATLNYVNFQQENQVGV